jgi:hypothetical protein
LLGLGIGVAIVGGVVVIVVVIVGGVVVIVAVIVSADAGFLANARKGKLAAPTAVTLSSCRRVRTRCSFVIGCSRSQLAPSFRLPKN